MEIATANAAYQATKETQDIRNFTTVNKTKQRNPYHSGRPSRQIIPTQTHHYPFKLPKLNPQNSTKDVESTPKAYASRQSNKNKKERKSQVRNQKIYKWLSRTYRRHKNSHKEKEGSFDFEEPIT